MLIKTNSAKIHNKKPIKKRDFTKFDSEMFLETIIHKFQHLPQTEDDPSKDLNQALKVLGDSLNQQAPLKHISRSKKKLPQKPSITTDLYKAIKIKNKMYRTLVRTRLPNTKAHNHCKKYRNKFRNIMEMSKRNYYQSLSKFLIGNRFHVKLCILSPENCKQSLQVKSWKAEVTAEKKHTQDYN